MESMSCTNRGCGAVYPAYARFCPRCGNANARVMSSFDRSRPNRPQKQACRKGGFWGLKGAWQFAGVLLVIPWWMSASRVPSTNQPQNITLEPAHRVQLSPSIYPRASIAPKPPNLSSLTAFETQLTTGFADNNARDIWQQQIAGQRVHWAGYVFTPNDGIGGPALTSNKGSTGPAIHLRTASNEAKSELRSIPENGKVEIEGVLMDDHWLHVLSVSRIR